MLINLVWYIPYWAWHFVFALQAVCFKYQQSPCSCIFLWINNYIHLVNPCCRIHLGPPPIHRLIPSCVDNSPGLWSPHHCLVLKVYPWICHHSFECGWWFDTKWICVQPLDRDSIGQRWIGRSSFRCLPSLVFVFLPVLLSSRTHQDLNLGLYPPLGAHAPFGVLRVLPDLWGKFLG